MQKNHNIITMNLIKNLCLLIAIIAMAGCASSTGSIDKVFGNNMPTMKGIHDKKFDAQKGIDREDVQRPIKNNNDSLQGELKTTVESLQQDFAFLPNPTMVMYIYQHLTTAGRPVPAYSTYFTFYEKNHVALPGEVGQQ